MRTMAISGLVVDIPGTAPAVNQTLTIAFRADMDGLLMTEQNDLPYKSTTEHAHMCGHDGHMAVLMTFA